MYDAEPGTMLGLAMAEFRKGDADVAGATLDRLFAANPEFNSTEADLLAARILEVRGCLPEALSAYERLSATYPGEEAKGRMALLLQKTGPNNGRARSSPRSADRRTRPHILSPGAAGMVRDRASSRMNCTRMTGCEVKQPEREIEGGLTFGWARQSLP